MTPLPLTFTRWSYTFTQVVREGDLAIYCQQHKDADVKRYEVIRIRQEEARTWPDGHTTEAREAYPGSSSWGLYGFTCHSLAEAKQLLAQLHIERSTDASTHSGQPL